MPLTREQDNAEESATVEDALHEEAIAEPANPITNAERPFDMVFGYDLTLQFGVVLRMDDLGTGAPSLDAMAMVDMDARSVSADRTLPPDQPRAASR